jgi:hypothetical protein
MKINTQNTIALMNGNNIAVKRFYTTNDIVKTVLEVYNEYHYQAANLAPQLKDNSVLKTCKNIYKFIRSNVKYREDGNEKQVVAAPGRLLERGYGDCKSMTVMAASILKNLNIPFCIRFVGYKNSETPNQFTHVYVVVPTGPNTYITLDPVHHTFNSEVKGVSIYRDYPGGNNNTKNKTMKGSNIGIGNFWQKLTQGTKTVAVAPTRGAFLVLVQLNFLALATLLYFAKTKHPDKYNEIRNKWYAWGGNRTELDRVVEKGAKNHPIGTNVPVLKNLEYVKNLRSSGMISGFNRAYIGADPVTESTAAPFIIAISGVLTSLAGLIIAIKTKPGGGSTPGSINWSDYMPPDIPTTDPEYNADYQSFLQHQEKKEKKDNTNLLLGLGATAAIALFLIPTIKK